MTLSRSPIVALAASLFCACGSPAGSATPTNPPSAARTPVTGALPGSAASNADSAAPAADPGWRVIRFVDVDDAFGAGTSLRSSLSNVGPNGVSLQLVARGVPSDVLLGARVRLHVARTAPTSATLAADVSDYRGGPNDGAPRTSWSASSSFPWQGDALDEAFAEVVLASGERYWFEVPYGFVAGPVPHAQPRDVREGPQRPPAMGTLGPRDHWIPFRDVTFDLGAIQGGWRLSARLANPFDAHAELELYRDDSRVGASMFLWGLHAPETHVEIIEASGATLAAMPMQLRLHDDGMRRSDDFHFNRSGPCGRGVGTFRALVSGGAAGDRTVEVTIPSSLYGYTHGTADPYDTHRIAGAGNVLGEGLF